MNSVDDPDVALMLAFQGGDESAFGELYTRYRDRLVNYTRRFVGNVAQGEEAAQDVFLKVYRAKARYRPESRFSTYLFRVATNHCLNLVQLKDRKLVDRGSDVTERFDGVLADEARRPDLDAERAELKTRLSRALASLVENQKAALLLCHYQGLSYREAAEVLEVSEGSVKSLIHRAREKLAKELVSLRCTAEAV